MWWYQSIRFSGEQVLLDTTQMYFYFCHKTPSMPLKRALMILAASCEFDKRHNSEIIERITDNEEVPMVCIRTVRIITFHFSSSSKLTKFFNSNRQVF